MALSLFTAISLAVIYRVTVNFTQLPYSPELRRPGSPQFLHTNNQIARSVEHLLKGIPGEHKASVLNYRYHPVIGTLVTLDVYSNVSSTAIKRTIERAVRGGHIGRFAVSNEGFQFHVVKGSVSECTPAEFTCRNGLCIGAELRCNGIVDCKDASDESVEYAFCSREAPVIHLSSTNVSAQPGETIELSAFIRRVPLDHQVIWLKNGRIIGQDSSTSDDGRVHVYHSSERYYLRITNARPEDAGEYKVTLDGTGIGATITVVVTGTITPHVVVCPPGNKACKSGHCLSSSLFCDGHRHCPDGDDEIGCHGMKCASHQIRCAIDDTCVLKSVACDGVKNCKDGTDELNCTVLTKPTTRSFYSHASRSTVLCPDGSTPEYSLHGSTYCWSNSVCPPDTACIHSQCCATALLASLRLCPTTKWECGSGECLPPEMRCDGESQCKDHSDELHCGNEKRSIESGCSPSQFKCDSGECIPIDKKCDRHYECADGTDETRCDYFIEATRAHSAANRVAATDQNGHGSNHEYQHRSAMAEVSGAEQSYRSNYVEYNQREEQTVQAAPPEKQCNDSEYRCPYLTHTVCVHYEKLCDGHDDCGDGSDEVKCESESHEEGVCGSAEYRCDNGQCIPAEHKCNRRYDCQDGTDETVCEYFKAAMSRHYSNRENEIENEEDRGQPSEEERRRNEQEEEIRRRAEERRLTEETFRREEEIRRREEAERKREEEMRRREEEIKRREGEERRREENRREELGEVDGAEQTDDEEQKRRREEEERIREQERRREEEELAREREEWRREEEERRREQEERRREEEEQRQEEEERRRAHGERLAAEEERRRMEEERERLNAMRQEYDRRIEQNLLWPTNEHDEKALYETGQEEPEAEEEGCLAHEFQCRSGECIDRRRVCDTRSDCQDASDEARCPRPTPHAGAQPQPASRRRDERPPDVGHQDLTITVYPQEQDVREGGEVVFDCRARTVDGAVYPEVRWSRVGGPLPSSAYESTGRLTISQVQQSDAGSYVCTSAHMGITKEAHVQLRVQSYGPQEMLGGLSASGLCRADERACGNNECVKADYVCDGEPDCRDRSDEQNCPSLRACEPNEFKCNNGRCVQKMWLCDGDDDCGDNSDEQQCHHKASSDGCGPTEFRCRDGRQCVLSSFHCDGTNDCQDGSDEVGCVQPTVVEAPETNKQVPAGGTFQLSCRAVAVPEPYINWRLNWGPVCDPPRCIQHSEGGLGTLTVNNAQPLDQGAYTCEAINVKGRVLATPDCIVRIVNIPAPPYEPRPEPQLKCDVAGSVSPQPGYGGQCQCKPLVTGPLCNQCVQGSYNLHEKAPQGCLKCFCFGITDQCRSSTWYRSKDKLTFNGDPQGVTLSDLEERDIEHNARFDYIYPGMITLLDGHYGSGVKYWRMPQRFLGNKLSSYGGELAFDIQHSCPGPLSTEPLIVIKGNRMTLVHHHRNGGRLPAGRTERITIDTYESNYEHEDGRPASREDLMMVLADLESFLIRASHCDGQRSTSLGDVSWEIAVDRDTQDRLALEVEQCSCPPGYTGLSCEDCAPGYERSGQGPYLGTCVPARAGPECSAAGAISTQPSYAGTCQCKTYASGPLCDQCPPNSFHMSAENPHGCIPCFCSGVTQQCSSSGYSRAVVEINYPHGSRDQLEVTTSDAHAPFQPQSRPQLTSHDITFSSFYETPGQTLYWKMPSPFLGNKVTSYGGTLKYVFRYSGAGPLNGDPDVILRGNDITLYYKNRQPTHPDRDNVVEVKLFEDRWHRVDGQQATREHLLMTLADLDALLIKMNYLDDCSSSSLISVSLEYAEPRHTGNQIAYEVEQCVCPPGYIGTSCEDCAPGYSRTGGGLYLGLCERCECHGHATQCDKEHGFCVDCQHNTEGDQCERCKPGFTGDARRGTPHDCQPAATRPPCNCNNHSPRGCDSFGRCLMCEHNTEGYHCEHCKKGFYGDAVRGTPFDCTPCPCPATSDCFLDAYGQVQCRNCPAGFSGRLCDECAPGYTRSRTHGGRECEPIGHVGPSDVVFVPTPEAPLRVQIDPPKNLQVPHGGSAQWYCRVVGHWGPNVRLEWTKVGTNTLPDSAIQTNGQLVINDVREADAGQYRCTARGPHQFATDDATLVVSRPQPVSPVVDPPSQTVDEGASAHFRCYVPGDPDAQLRWRKEDGSTLGYGVSDDQGTLSFARVTSSDAGAYICSAQNPRGGSPIDSSPAYLGVNARRPSDPVIEPPTQTVDEGERAKFRCYLPGVPDAQLSWRRQDGNPLGQGVTDSRGILTLPRVQPSDAGAYVCTAQDARGGSPIDSRPAYLNVNPRRHGSAPTLMIDPPSQTVNENEPAQFKCWVPGVLGCELTWHKEYIGGPLPYGVYQSGGVLKIPRAQLHDAGNYICTAANKYGIGQSPAARLIVNRPPQPPRVDPPEMTVNDGDPARFRCWVPGDPAARLSWRLRSGEPIPYGSQENEGILNFPRARQSHAGSYVCTATDPEGRNPPMQSPEVRLIIRQPISPHVDPHEQTVAENEPSRIRCWVPGNPSAILTWRKHGGELPDQADDRGGILTIPRTALHDAGNYICSAQGPRGGPGVDSLPARVNVRRPEAPRYEPPVRAEKPSERPVVDPPEQTVNEGEPVRFRCYVPNESGARVRWSYGQPDSPLPPYVQDDRGVLTIARTDHSHEGEYFCTYDAPEESLHSPPARLRVTQPGGPPRPEASPADQTVKTGEPARFHCEANSETPARITWGYREADGPLRGDVVQEGDDVFIRSADESNSGEYICTATNQYGSAEAVPVRLHVTENEEPPTARVVPRVWNGKPGDRHQFRCITTGVPPPQVTWTGPGGSQLPDDVNDIGGGVLDFSNGRADLNGDYTCTAVNLVGEASDHGSVNIGPSLTVRTTPPGPRIVLTAGESLEVKCEAFGEPEPEVEWLHDPGPERGDLPDDFKPVTISEQFIRHPSIGTGNAGVYTCKGSNSQATATKDIHVEVVEASRVATVAILGGSTQWLEPGSPAELICAATGNSLVDRLQWVKVDGELPPDVEDHNEPGILHFANFKSSDSGEYECRGYRNEEEIASAKVTVHPTNGGPLGAAQVEIDEPTVRVVNHGDSIVLKCSVHGGDNNGANFEWALLRGGSLVRQLSHESSLRIKKADASNDSGVYRCEVEDDDGELLGAAYAAVTIAHGGPTNAQIVKFDEKSEATITCPVYAVPGAEVTWEKQDGSIPDGAVTSRNKLTIKEFDDEATGTYICKVSVEGQEIEGYVTALIYVPDTIIQVLLEASSESVALGDRAWFDCKVAGDPDAVITWSREHEEDLPDNAQVTGNRLLFVNVREDNGGLYKCHAQTKEGPLEARTVLNVGSAKRKRKHLHRNTKTTSRMHRGLPQKKKRQQSVFGSWFTSV